MHLQSYSAPEAGVHFARSGEAYVIEICERVKDLPKTTASAERVEELKIRLATLRQQIQDIGGEVIISVGRGIVVRASVPSSLESSR